MKKIEYGFNPGQRFGRWTILDRYVFSARGEKKYLCRCDCGTERYVLERSLKYGGSQSCGCRKKEHDQELGTLLTHVGGTSLEMIQSQKLPRDNTTGYKGVYLVRGKYLAKIVFQKKQYFLGTYDSIEEAAAARKSAEALLFGETAAFIQKWKESAAKNPEWAGDNPVEIHVSRDRDGRLAVSYSPQIL